MSSAVIIISGREGEERESCWAMPDEPDDDDVCPSDHLSNMPPGVAVALSSYTDSVLASMIARLPDFLGQASQLFTIDRCLALLNELCHAKMVFSEPQRISLICILYDHAFRSASELRLRLATSCHALLKLKPTLSPKSLQLDHKPLLNALWSICDQATDWRSADGCGAGIRHEDRAALGNLAIRARKYFHDDSFDEITSTLLPFLSGDGMLFRVLGLFSLLLPCRTRSVAKQDDDGLTPILLNVLSWMSQSVAAKSVLFQIFARCASHGAFAFDPHLPLFYTMFTQTLGLTVEHSSRDPYPRSGDSKSWPNELKFLRRYCGTSKAVARDMAKIAAYTISSANAYLLRHFLSSVSSYLRPNNTGPWSPLLGSFLESFAIHFSKRYKRDARSDHGRLSREFCREIMCELVELGAPALYASSQALVQAVIKMYSNFSAIDPTVIEAPFLRIVDRTLRLPVSPLGQRIACLKLSTYVLGAIRDRDWFHEHLYLCADSLHPGDISQLTSAMQFLAAFFDLYDESDREFIGNFAPHLMLKLLHICENVADYSKDSDKAFKEDFAKLVDSFFRILPSETHRICANYIFEFVFSRTLENARRLLGIMCSSASASDSEWALSHFVPIFVSSVRDASGHELDWLVYHLACVVRRVGSHLLPYLPELLSIVRQSQRSCDDPCRLSYSNKIVRRALGCLAGIYPIQTAGIERRPSLLCDNEFDLRITWHVPSNDELNAASLFAQDYLQDAVAFLQQGALLAKTVPAAIRSMQQVHAVVKGLSTTLNESRYDLDPSLHIGKPSGLVTPIMVSDQTFGDYLVDGLLAFLSRCGDDGIAVFARICDLLRILCRPAGHDAAAALGWRTHAGLRDSQKNLQRRHRCSVRRLLIDSSSRVVHDRIAAVQKFVLSGRQTSELVRCLLHKAVLASGSSPARTLSCVMLQGPEWAHMQSFVARLFESCASRELFTEAYMRAISGLLLIPTVAVAICSDPEKLDGLIATWPSFANVDDATFQRTVALVFQTYWQMLHLESSFEPSSYQSNNCVEMFTRALPFKHQIALCALISAMPSVRSGREFDRIAPVLLQNLLSEDNSFHFCSVFVIPQLRGRRLSVSSLLPSSGSPSSATPVATDHGGRSETASQHLSTWAHQHFTALFDSLIARKHGGHHEDKIRSELQKVFRLKSKPRSHALSNEFSVENVRLWQCIIESAGGMISLILSSLADISLEDRLDRDRAACTSELFCAAILHMSDATDQEDAVAIQEQLPLLLSNLIDRIEPESYSCWIRSIRFAVCQVSHRLLSSLINEIASKTFANLHTTLLGEFYAELLSVFLSEYTWQCVEIANGVLRSASDWIERCKSDIVRRAFSRLMSHSILCLSRPSSRDRLIHFQPVLVPNHPCLTAFCEIVSRIRSLNEHSLRQYIEILGLFMMECYEQGPMMVFGDLLNQIAVPVLAAGYSQSDPELLSLMDRACYRLGWVGFGESDLCQMLANIIGQCRDSNLTTRGKLSLMRCARLLISRHAYYLSYECVQCIYEGVFLLLVDPEIRCRNSASMTLTVLFVHTRWLQLPAIADIIANCQHLIDSSDVESVCKIQLVRRHGGVLGLIALMRAAAYDVPDWLGEVLMTLSSLADEKGPIGSCIRQSFIDWRHMHVTDFHDLQQHLTEGQLEAIKYVDTSPSYII